MSTTTGHDLLARAEALAKELAHCDLPVKTAAWESFDTTVYRLLREVIGPARSDSGATTQTRTRLLHVIHSYPTPLRPPPGHRADGCGSGKVRAMERHPVPRTDPPGRRRGHRHRPHLRHRVACARPAHRHRPGRPHRRAPAGSSLHHARGSGRHGQPGTSRTAHTGRDGRPVGRRRQCKGPQLRIGRGPVHPAPRTSRRGRPAAGRGAVCRAVRRRPRRHTIHGIVGSARGQDRDQRHRTARTPRQRHPALVDGLPRRGSPAPSPPLR